MTWRREICRIRGHLVALVFGELASHYPVASVVTVAGIIVYFAAHGGREIGAHIVDTDAPGTVAPGTVAQGTEAESVASET